MGETLTWDSPRGLAAAEKMGWPEWNGSETLQWIAADGDFAAGYGVHHESSSVYDYLVPTAVFNLFLNDRAREVGEKANMCIRPDFCDSYEVRWRKPGTDDWETLALCPDYTTACIVMAELAMKETPK